MEQPYDPLYVWIDDHDRLLLMYTVFYAWQRRRYLLRAFHTWILRYHSYRLFRRIIPDAREGLHQPHMLLRTNRDLSLPSREHYINLIVDYHQQRFNAIPLDRIIYHPTSAVSVLVDFVDNRYITLPRRPMRHTQL